MAAATYDWGRVIRAIAPAANPRFVAAFASYGEAFRTTLGGNVEAMAGILAQAAHETRGFTKFEENLRYTTAARLMAVWPKRFPTAASAAPFVNNPRALANKVYNGRMGNTPSGDDGWTFRGVGAFHHTGKAEHEARARALGMAVDEFGAAMRDAGQAALIMTAAISYARERGVIAAMIRGNHTRASELINGGRIGLTDRLALTRKAKAALAGLPPVQARPMAPAPPDTPKPETPANKPRKGLFSWLSSVFSKTKKG